MNGQFRPKNIQKYKGDVNKIFYRSSWELKVMMSLDHDSTVLSWSSEEIIIPYISPIDGKRHRYFPDFWVKKKEGEYLLEVKPAHQCREPKISKKITKRYLNEIKTWGTNVAKWKAAESFCKKAGWRFQILTEKELGIS